MNIERVIEAIRTINRLHNLGDAVYDVRNSEENMKSLADDQNSWHGKPVTEYSEAVAVLREEGVLL